MSPHDVLTQFADRAGRWPRIIPEADRVAARGLAKMSPRAVEAVMEAAGRWREFRADHSAKPGIPRHVSLAWLSSNWATAYVWLHPEERRVPQG